MSVVHSSATLTADAVRPIPGTSESSIATLSSTLSSFLIAFSIISLLILISPRKRGAL